VEVWAVWISEALDRSLRTTRPGTPAFFETNGYIAVHSWRERIMPTGDVRAGFAIKVGYFFLAAAVLVFIAMLVLTLHA
jgi:hypothetical protein